MNGTCETCRYWDKYDRTCGAAEWVDKGKHVIKDTLAFYAQASDDQGLSAAIVTGPKFGCVLFDTKTKASPLTSHEITGLAGKTKPEREIQMETNTQPEQAQPAKSELIEMLGVAWANNTAEWLKRRAATEYDTLTTLTILERKIKTCRQRIALAERLGCRDATGADCDLIHADALLVDP